MTVYKIGKPTKATGLQEGTRLISKSSGPAYVCPCGHWTYMGLKYARRHARSKDCQWVKLYGLSKVVRSA